MVESDWEDGRHFTGTMTMMLVQYMQAQPRADLLETVCAAAGEARSVDELSDVSGWSSYWQVRRLLETLDEATSRSAALREIGMVAVAGVHAVTTTTVGAATPTSTMLQDAGSLASMYRDIGIATGVLSSIVMGDSKEVGENEWLMHYRFKPGFAAYPEYCEFSVGMLACSSVLFGFPPAHVTHESCECRGDDACLFRVHLDASDDQRRRADFFEMRAQTAINQLDALRATLADLVSTVDVEEVLSRVLRSAASAVLAPAFVLALTANRSVRRRVYGRGLSDAAAAAIARELLDDDRPPDHERAIVEIASARCRYGILAAIRPDSLGFFPQELVVLRAYAGVAAAALDSATAVDDAHRQANTARSLLAFSQALTTAATSSEIAETIVLVAPQLTNCDQTVVVLRDPGSKAFTLEALGGCSPTVAARLCADVAAWDWTDQDWADQHAGPALEMMLTREGAHVTVASTITADGVVLGWVAVGSDDPFALGDDDGHERISGLAAQAAIALSNVQRLEQIRRQALYDGLTGLPNRTLILDRVDRMLTRARRERIPAAALFLDIDGFKTVNDTIGHDVGDRLLAAVAARLQTTLRDADTIGRLGGDEFVVLVEGTSLDAGPEVVAQRLLDVLSEPFVLDDPAATRLRVNASIGIASGDSASHVELLRDADVALYAAKAAGKGCFVVFQPAMRTAIRERARLEADLAAAVDGDQFFTVYQPILDLRTMQIIGAEALLRWKHPGRGVVQPGEFISVLEETGLIIDVGRWVLVDACRQTAAWHAEGRRIDISVNVSAHQLESEHFVEHVRAALDTSGLNPSSLILEITESVIMRDPDAVVHRIARIKTLGVRVAIDDFGTGYSSLSSLRRFPVDCLKIDRSFIAAMSESPEAVALVSTLVQLGKALGMQTLAEGIEDSDQVDYLQDRHCDSGQGFLFAKPLAPAALEELLDAEDSLRVTA
jgi:diguanylate cyclase (GGDEF)-like protein